MRVSHSCLFCIHYSMHELFLTRIAPFNPVLYALHVAIGTDWNLGEFWTWDLTAFLVLGDLSTDHTML